MNRTNTPAHNNLRKSLFATFNSRSGGAIKIRADLIQTVTTNNGRPVIRYARGSNLVGFLLRDDPLPAIAEQAQSAHCPPAPYDHGILIQLTSAGNQQPYYTRAGNICAMEGPHKNKPHTSLALLFQKEKDVPVRVLESPEEIEKMVTQVLVPRKNRTLGRPIGI